MSEFESHPLAEVVPPMSEAEYVELRTSIADRGLEDDIVLLDGRVLDGRHRLRACEELGVEPRTVDYNGQGDPLGFVIAKNLHRRHLTTGQRAMAALNILDHEKKLANERMLRGKADPPQNSGEGAHPPHYREAADRAGRRFRVSRNSVETARAIKAKRPDLAEKVARGELTLNGAHQQALGRKHNAARDRRLAEQKASEPLTGRDLKWAKGAKGRIETFVGQCQANARALPDVRVELAARISTAEELSDWAECIRAAEKALEKFRKRIPTGGGQQ